MSPTALQIDNIVSKASLSPSPDNCQPWQLEWDGESLSVFHLGQVSNHPLNPANLASILTLGCLIESIALAASTHRIKTICEMKTFIEGDRALWASIRFEESTDDPDPLSQMLSLRSTDRRLYGGGSAELDSLRLPKANAVAESHKLTKIPSELLEYIISSEMFLTDHPKVLPAIMKWVRFTTRHARKCGDGITWRNMLAKFWEVPTMLIIRSFPALSVLFRIPARQAHRSRTKAQLLSSAGVICVSIKLKDRKIALEEVTEAGRLMLRTWLKLTEAGFGSQPLSFSTLPLLYLNTGNADGFFTARSDLLVQGEALLRRVFAIPQDRLPIWMMRTGLSSSLPVELRTFRKPANVILNVLKKITD